MARLLAAERVAALANLLENIAVAHFGLNHLDAGLLHCNFQTEVAHDGGNESVACEVTTFFQTERHDGHDLVAVDNFAGVVYGKASICIAIVRDAEICVVFKHSRLQRAEMRRSVTKINVVTVWVCSDYDNLCTGIDESLR